MALSGRLSGSLGSWANRVNCSGLRVETIDSVVFGRHPDETLAVLEQAEYVVVGQRMGIVGIVLIIVEPIRFRIVT